RRPLLLGPTAQELDHSDPVRSVLPVPAIDHVGHPQIGRLRVSLDLADRSATLRVGYPTRSASRRRSPGFRVHDRQLLLKDLLGRASKWSYEVPMTRYVALGCLGFGLMVTPLLTKPAHSTVPAPSIGVIDLDNTLSSTPAGKRANDAFEKTRKGKQAE